jgi:hypothetical protein
MPVYSGENMNEVCMPDLEPGENPICFITHDESTFYANDGSRLLWQEDGKSTIRPKSLGSSIMVSAFVCQCHGIMISENMKSYVLFKAGRNRQGWFTNDDLIKQFNDAYPLFVKMHPNMDFVFAFDNSMTHHKRPPDGLDAALITMKDGGVGVPLMRETSYIKDGVLFQ